MCKKYIYKSPHSYPPRGLLHINSRYIFVCDADADADAMLMLPAGQEVLQKRKEFGLSRQGCACIACRSEGFPLTCYLIPVRDGTGVWTFGNLRSLPCFKQETRMFLKLTKRTHFLKKVLFLRTKKPLRARG